MARRGGKATMPCLAVFIAVCGAVMVTQGAEGAGIDENHVVHPLDSLARVLGQASQQVAADAGNQPFQSSPVEYSTIKSINKNTGQFENFSTRPQVTRCAATEEMTLGEAAKVQAGNQQLVKQTSGSASGCADDSNGAQSKYGMACSPDNKSYCKYPGYEDFGKKYCRKTCNTCAPTTKSTAGKNVCADDNDSAQKEYHMTCSVDALSYCNPANGMPNYGKYCQKTCKLCPPGSKGGPPCEDNNLCLQKKRGYKCTYQFKGKSGLDCKDAEIKACCPVTCKVCKSTKAPPPPPGLSTLSPVTDKAPCECALGKKCCFGTMKGSSFQAGFSQHLDKIKGGAAQYCAKKAVSSGGCPFASTHPMVACMHSIGDGAFQESNRDNTRWEYCKGNTEDAKSIGNKAACLAKGHSWIDLSDEYEDLLATPKGRQVMEQMLETELNRAGSKVPQKTALLEFPSMPSTSCLFDKCNSAQFGKPNCGRDQMDGGLQSCGAKYGGLSGHPIMWDVDAVAIPYGRALPYLPKNSVKLSSVDDADFAKGHAWNHVGEKTFMCKVPGLNGEKKLAKHEHLVRIALTSAPLAPLCARVKVVRRIKKGQKKGPEVMGWSEITEAEGSVKPGSETWLKPGSESSWLKCLENGGSEDACVKGDTKIKCACKFCGNTNLMRFQKCASCDAIATADLLRHQEYNSVYEREFEFDRLTIVSGSSALKESLAPNRKLLGGRKATPPPPPPPPSPPPPRKKRGSKERSNKERSNKALERTNKERGNKARERTNKERGNKEQSNKERSNKERTSKAERGEKAHSERTSKERTSKEQASKKRTSNERASKEQTSKKRTSNKLANKASAKAAACSTCPTRKTAPGTVVTMKVWQFGNRYHLNKDTARNVRFRLGKLNADGTKWSLTKLDGESYLAWMEWNSVDGKSFKLKVDQKQVNVNRCRPLETAYELHKNADSLIRRAVAKLRFSAMTGIYDSKDPLSDRSMMLNSICRLIRRQGCAEEEDCFQVQEQDRGLRKFLQIYQTLRGPEKYKGLKYHYLKNHVMKLCKPQEEKVMDNLGETSTANCEASQLTCRTGFKDVTPSGEREWFSIPATSTKIKARAIRCERKVCSATANNMYSQFCAKVKDKAASGKPDVVKAIRKAYNKFATDSEQASTVKFKSCTGKAPKVTSNAREDACKCEKPFKSSCVIPKFCSPSSKKKKTNIGFGAAFQGLAKAQVDASTGKPLVSKAEMARIQRKQYMRYMKQRARDTLEIKNKATKEEERSTRASMDARRILGAGCVVRSKTKLEAQAACPVLALGEAKLTSGRHFRVQKRHASMRICSALSSTKAAADAACTIQATGPQLKIAKEEKDMNTLEGQFQSMLTAKQHTANQLGVFTCSSLSSTQAEARSKCSAPFQAAHQHAKLHVCVAQSHTRLEAHAVCPIWPQADLRK